MGKHEHSYSKVNTSLDGPFYAEGQNAQGQLEVKCYKVQNWEEKCSCGVTNGTTGNYTVSC